MKIAIGVSAAVAVFALIVAGQIRDRLHTMPPAHVDIPADGVTLAMQDADGRPVVDVRINGSGPYRFILDTGATTTVIGTDLNGELSLPAPQGIKARPTTGGMAPGFARVEELRVGDAVLRGVFAAVLPLRSLFPGGDGPRGVLSASSFPGYLVTFDYRQKRISIRKGALAESDFEYPGDEALPTVPVTIAGHIVRVHLDTGARVGLSLPRRYLAELPLAAPPVEAGQNRTLAGEFPAWRAKVVGAVGIGRFPLDVGEIEFSDAHGGAGAAVGRLGYDALCRFVVTLDSRNRRVRLEE